MATSTSSRTTSRTGAVLMAALLAGIDLALLLILVNGRDLPSERLAAAGLLILCFALFGVGGFLYTGRAIFKWSSGESARYRAWERGLVIAAVVATVLGLMLLADLLRSTGDSVFAQLGMAGYLLGAAVVVSAETTFVGTHEWVYPSIIFYVVLAFLAQAAFGAAILRTDLLPRWVGWATILWNLGWLVALPILSPRELYYPALHHAAPLLIGIVLLVQG